LKIYVEEPELGHLRQPTPAFSREFDFQTYSWDGCTVPITPLAALPGRPCPIAAALEVVGEKWALLTIREIALGAHRFGEIVTGTGAPRDRIAARLKTLESAGVVTRTPYQDHPRRDEYHLTDSGRGLIPTLDALLAWGRDNAVALEDPLRAHCYRTIDRYRETP
jgi:DNA-binding HxlR family transcriptional regulator